MSHAEEHLKTITAKTQSIVIGISEQCHGGAPSSPWSIFSFINFSFYLAAFGSYET